MTFRVNSALRSAIPAALATVAMLAPTGASADARIEIGVLNCTVEGDSGFIFGSTKTLNCVYEAIDNVTQSYVGTIERFGIDIGRTEQGFLSWAVLAPTTDIAPTALAGRYVGVSAEASVAVGIGANALIGGSNDSIALQPVSIQAQQGLNFAVGIAEMELVAVTTE